jgi:hypothetical protein
MPTPPTILVIMVDQLTGTLFPDGPAPCPLFCLCLDAVIAGLLFYAA